MKCGFPIAKIALYVQHVLLCLGEEWRRPGNGHVHWPDWPNYPFPKQDLLIWGQRTGGRAHLISKKSTGHHKFPEMLRRHIESIFQHWAVALHPYKEGREGDTWWWTPHAWHCVRYCIEQETPPLPLTPCLHSTHTTFHDQHKQCQEHLLLFSWEGCVDTNYLAVNVNTMLTAASADGLAGTIAYHRQMFNLDMNSN